MKGVTHFEKLEEQLSIFIRAARGIKFDTCTFEELPAPYKIGPFDPATVDHWQSCHSLVIDLNENTSFVEDKSPPVPLSDIIGNGTIRSQDFIQGTRKETYSSNNPKSFFSKIVVNGIIRCDDKVDIYTGKLGTPDKSKRKVYALKVFTLKDATQASTLMLEAKISMSLSHDNICRFVNVIQTPT